MGVLDQLKHAWNAFTSESQTKSFGTWAGDASFGQGGHRNKLTTNNGRMIIASIYNQIALDVAAISMQHVKIDRDDNDRYIETKKSGLNYCLNLEANLDETAQAFKQNMVMTMFDKGVIAITPIDTDDDPELTNAYDIHTMRVGEVMAWYPDSVRVSVYNDKVGRKEELTLKKTALAIIENPLYSVMNETNSTLQRLIRKLSLLDSLDEQASSGKLDIIVQLPYVVKSDARKQQAQQRRVEMEEQLTGSKYGVAYMDATEKITQLNRPAENNMMAQVEYLTTMLYSQLGLTEEVFKGTADEAVMLNYHNRTIKPILTALAQGMERSFLSKTARTQGQAIRFFRDPFSLVTVKDMAEIGDKFTRNEIMSANELRAAIGLKPRKDAKADELRNSNMPREDTEPAPSDTTQKEGEPSK